MKTLIRKIVLEAPILYNFIRKIRNMYRAMGGVTITNKGMGKIKKVISGTGHEIIVEKNVILNNVLINISGNGNKIVFHEGVRIGPDCNFWMQGNNIKIMIGKNTSFTRLNHINAQEDNTSIIIGEDCMFSNNITVRTSDSHPFYDLESGERLNLASDIEIGNHVWICPNTKIMKGAIIGNGSIVGSDTTISSFFPDNVLVVGRPARIVRSNIQWTREDLF